MVQNRIYGNPNDLRYVMVWCDKVAYCLKVLVTAVEGRVVVKNMYVILMSDDQLHKKHHE